MACDTQDRGTGAYASAGELACLGPQGFLPAAGHAGRRWRYGGCGDGVFPAGLARRLAGPGPAL